MNPRCCYLGLVSPQDLQSYLKLLLKYHQHLKYLMNQKYLAYLAYHLDQKYPMNQKYLEYLGYLGYRPCLAYRQHQKYQMNLKNL